MNHLINQGVYEDWVLPELKRQKELARQVAIDEATMDIGQTRYETFPYTPRDDRRVKPASIWAFISQFSI